MFAYVFRAMFSRDAMLRRFFLSAAIIVSSFLLPGCSFIDLELNNRGGFIDAKLDERWMIADTKQMRVLRAYILVGSISRLSRENYYKSERANLIKQVNTAVNVAHDAFACAYARPGECVYFDERMAELEVVILRLAIAVLSKEENENLTSQLSKALGDTIPILKAADSLTSALDALTSTGELALQAGKLVKAVVQVGQAAYFTGRRLGALYRDSIELDMVTVLASLRYQCDLEQQVAFTDQNRYKTSAQFYGGSPAEHSACAAYKKGFETWKRGSGDFKLWVQYLYADAAQFRSSIIPDQNSFIQASDLIWRSCEQMTDSPNLIAECLGRRKQNPECGCTQGDECPYLTYGEPKSIDSGIGVSKTADKDVSSSSDPNEVRNCPLIAFHETWSYRKGRYGKASARLDWLSIKHYPGDNPGLW